MVSIPYPAGMALWLVALVVTGGLVALSQSPIQRGWLCGSHIQKPEEQAPIRLNPLSSGDGFVAYLAASVGHLIFVSIPYPAGMALWLGIKNDAVKRGIWSQSPIQRGWLCGHSQRNLAQRKSCVSIPYPAGMALWLGVPYGTHSVCGLNPLSSGDGFVAL